MNRRFSAVFRRFQAVFRRFPPVSIFFVATAPSHRYSRLCRSLKPPTNLGTISAPFLHHFLHFDLRDTLQINDLRSELHHGAVSNSLPAGCRAQAISWGHLPSDESQGST